MFTTNRTLTALDMAFSATEVIASFDYVEAGRKVITSAATFAAVIIGVCSYVYTALQLWWDSHGETVQVIAIRAIVTVADTAGACYTAGRNFRPVATLWANRLTDTAFYQLAAL